ncbi:type II secretion system F family protein [Pararhizobium sp. IMCC21322]|uniref:type II secretion system F family protein n=1 Tax=Pararhizobium sp. IMCC21322 TaxID=3067903 RepID=UPI002740FDED|nr:type II secretion system F family protein [Pararhizobium sp. IMCC21322]
MSENLILLATFVSVLIVAAVFIGFFNSRHQITTRFDAETEEKKEDDIEVPQDIRGLSISEATLVKNYYSVVRADKDPNSVNNRLVRAGYFHSGATRTYHLIRVALSLMGCSLIMFGVPFFAPELPQSSLLLVALIFGALVFVICNIVLEKIGDSRETDYRRLFPDFMDTLIVCVDAGLSVEAAVDRVSKEFLKSSSKNFGLHLAMMMLEVRGGRRLRDALSNLADRLGIDEAKSLSILFRQSEELGASVTKALRVFSQEMREKRMISAEEKANALPLKMLFPLALFLFPISILIVAVPIIMKVLGVLQSLGT